MQKTDEIDNNNTFDSDSLLELLLKPLPQEIIIEVSAALNQDNSQPTSSAPSIEINTS